MVNMFTSKYIQETNPVIEEPVFPVSQTFDEPFPPTLIIDTTPSNSYHISENEQCFIKLLDGQKLNNLKIVEVS